MQRAGGAAGELQLRVCASALGQPWGSRLVGASLPTVTVLHLEVAEANLCRCVPGAASLTFDRQEPPPSLYWTRCAVHVLRQALGCDSNAGLSSWQQAAGGIHTCRTPDAVLLPSLICWIHLGREWELMASPPSHASAAGACVRQPPASAGGSMMTHMVSWPSRA